MFKTCRSWICMMMTLVACSAVQSPRAEARQPVIFGFDASRGGMCSIGQGSAFVGLRSLIVASFPGTTFRNAATITDDALARVDVVILCSATSCCTRIVPLSEGEQARLLSFVQRGGRAIILSDNDSFAVGADQSNESILDPFGLDAIGTLSGVRAATVPNPDSNQVTSGPYGRVGSYTTNFPGWFSNLGAYAQAFALLSDNQQPILAVIEEGMISRCSGPRRALHGSKYWVFRLSCGQQAGAAGVSGR